MTEEVNTPKWLDFEKMIAQIYASILPNAIVKHNDSIRGIDSEIDRQIDVSIHFMEAGCEFLIIIQAKNYKKPANINIVGEFSTVINDVRAQKGILICNAGFTKNAQKLASSLGIELFTAHDAETKDWATTLTIPVLWKKITPIINCSFEAHLEAGDSISSNMAKMVFSTDRGKTKIDILETFIRLWNSKRIPQENGVEHTLLINNEGKLEIMVGLNKWRSVEEFQLVYVIEKQLYRKDVASREFTGLCNYMNGNIEIQRLGIEIPPLEASNGWSLIEDDIENLFSKERIIVTVEQPIISKEGFSPTKFSLVEALDDLW